ncbi:MAG: hypothetical protein E6I50_01465 [Chloroflexi bacterium]|nr:MAG: hypothetical protein E6I50_01465 [Chloroflexota bacterium]
MDEITLDALRYHRWANLQLLEACGGLTPEQLALTAPGTYGSIADTFMHMLAGEGGYIRRLKGAERRRSADEEFPGIEPLKERFGRSADELIAAAQALRGGETTQVDFDGEVAPLKQSMIVVQALHHGNDHRTHIGTILGFHSLPGPDIDVWMYGLAMHRASPSGPAGHLPMNGEDAKC